MRKLLLTALLLGLLLTQAAAGTLIIDAGHGGFDGGAVSAAGTSEQDINLAVAQKTELLLRFFGVKTQMTRRSAEALDYDPSRSVRENKVRDIHAREALVQNTDDPIFLSIHLNQFPDPQYHGAQVFYSRNHASSKTLAESLQQTLVQGVQPENTRVAKAAESSIYLMKKLTCPAVIAECGFLSNPAEARRLESDAYQKQLSVCLACGYLQWEDKE